LSAGTSRFCWAGDHGALTARPLGAIALSVPRGEELSNPRNEVEHKRPDVARLRQNLDAYMARQGLRSTEQRRHIVETFFESTAHVTLDTLLERVRSADPRIGYATVYRTMKMLAEAGIALERKFGDGFTRYELADDEAHHDHLICLECRNIEEFEEPQIEELQEQVATRHGFRVSYHKHELYGLCRSCAEKAEASRR
jgi:Fur family ferric uptake transcriptional regulator